MARAQSAIEFMLTYSWVFIIIALFIVTVVLISDSRPPSVYLGSSCNIQPLLPCTEALVTYNAIAPLQFYIVFTNELGTVMYFQPNAINVSTSSIGGTPNYQYGNCQPTYASKGSQIICTTNLVTPTKPKAGSQATLTFTVSYSLCNSNSKSSCAPGVYKSSGFSAETMSPSNINLDTVTFMTAPPIATIVLSGITYYNGISIYMPSGNYILFSTAPTGYQSLSWSISSATSTLSSTTSANTVLTLSSNAIITASYIGTSSTTSTSTSQTTTSTSASTTSSTTSTTTSTIATTTVYYVPIVLTNSQASPTPSPFQQMITINSQSYSAYINSNWNNVEFTTGPDATGTVLQAWVESGASNGAASTVVWVNLPYSIAASGTNTINMDFMGGSVMSAAGPTGEAPQLSGTYAQYDNGASVFNFYDDFVGTSLSSKWTLVSGTAGTDYKINNGFQLLTTITRVQSSSSMSGSFVLEAYHQLVTEAANGWDLGIYSSLSSVYCMHPDSGSTWYNNNGGWTEIAGSTVAAGPGDYYLWQLINNGGSITTNFDSPSYSAYYTATFSNPLNNAPIIFGERCDNALAGQTMNDIIYWVRSRAYPPSGAMPGASFGGVIGTTANLPATFVIGQANLVSGTKDQGGTANAFDLYSQTAETFDSVGDLWVADSSNNRVLEFRAPLSTDEAASVVLGQTSFTGVSPNQGGSVSSTTLEYPAGLAFDSGGNLWVADSGNNRVLRYTPANLVTGGAASIAIGQPNLNTGTWVGPADNTFQDPMGVAFDGSGDIWVADYADSRVMGFMPGGSNAVTGGWATWILGQANPSGYSGNQGGLFGNGVAANSLDYPVGLAFDSHGNLWVADDANNRILEYLTPNCYSNDGLASIVLGQPSLSVKNANQGGGASSTALYSPYYLAFDSSGDLWASDASNSRVLEYLPSNFVTDGAAALVIGQANFAASSSNQGGSVAANTLSGPGGIALDHSGNLWIVDRGNSRVLEYLIP